MPPWCEKKLVWHRRPFDGILKNSACSRDQMRMVREEQQSSGVLCVFLPAALKQLHGTAGYEGEQEDIEKEKNNLIGFKSKKPWELFADRSVRWQLLTIFLLNAAQQLNGINAVCTRWCSYLLSLTMLNLFPNAQNVHFTSLQKCGIDLYRNKVRCPHLNLMILSIFAADLLLRRLRVQTSWYSRW